VRRPLHEPLSGNRHDSSHGSAPPGVHAGTSSQQAGPSKVWREATCRRKKAWRNRMNGSVSIELWSGMISGAAVTIRYG